MSRGPDQILQRAGYCPHVVYKNAWTELMCGSGAGSREDGESDTHVCARAYQNCYRPIAEVKRRRTAVSTWMGDRL
ncbi:hypothetical protein EVAR_34265_1 [Eumeta japonica]|uniref:Uncharacterized protein n=1 Tax=Eumeta variegata TaxID=151549 RepID=A0A4C1VYM9_EUMVA|nr:hypothetical protein EVAR_34265_1 [Eumeta japonica]